MKYKGYTILTGVVCFDIRWFSYGEGECGDGFFGRHFESYEKACEAIDEYTTAKFLEKRLNEISEKLDVSKEMILNCLRKSLEIR